MANDTADEALLAVLVMFRKMFLFQWQKIGILEK